MNQQKETKPKWNNLKSNLCPRCSTVLEHTTRSAICPGKDEIGRICGFSCTLSKFNLIVTDRYFGFPRESFQVHDIGDVAEANLSALNNMEVHEDVLQKGLTNAHESDCDCDGCIQEEHERHNL